LPPQITGHAQSRHRRVSNHSPIRCQGYIAAQPYEFWRSAIPKSHLIALFTRLFPGNPALTLPAHRGPTATPTRRGWAPEAALPLDAGRGTGFTIVADATNLMVAPPAGLRKEYDEP
jgi:hypothetical protein